MLNSIKEALEKGDTRTAADLCRRHEEDLKKDPLFHLYRGVLWVQMGDLGGAENSFRQCIKLDQTLVAAHKNLAQIYKVRKDPRSRQALLEASWLDPQDKAVFEDLKILGARKEDYPEADIVFYTGTPYLSLKFSPDSLISGAIGGSETAFMMMAKELSVLGQRVICFCNTPSRREFGKVLYVPVEEFFLYHHFYPQLPVFIASRFLYPFEKDVRARLKILWLHDSLGCANFDDDIGAQRDRIDAFFALSDYQIERISKRFDLPVSKFFKTRNGFITEHFTAPALDRELALIYFSRPERGLKEALEVFSHLREKISGLQFHVCSYTQASELEKDAHFAPFLPRLKEEGIHYHGGLSKKDLTELLNRCSLCLYPNVSDAETSCIVAIESMAAGCPLVTSDRGALPETLAHDQGGIIVPFRQNKDFIADLEKAASYLLTHPTVLRDLSVKARRRAYRLYRWSAVAGEWAHFIKKSS